MLTAIVLTRNEEKHIQRCLQSLAFCDQIIVIDDGSNDQTASIVQKMGARFLSRKINGDFAAQRNSADNHVDHGWILHIDADEEVSTQLSREIQNVIAQNNYAALFIKRVDIFLGKQLRHGELAKAAQKGFLRLYKKGVGQWEGSVHERFVTSASTDQLMTPLIHYAHVSVSDFLQAINCYSTLRAHELKKKGMQTNIFQLLVYPPAKFIYTFFVKGGWMDGKEGFIYSFLMSFHSFLVRAKMY